jgi:hypothetical protein
MGDGDHGSLPAGSRPRTSRRTTKGSPGFYARHLDATLKRFRVGHDYRDDRGGSVLPSDWRRLPPYEHYENGGPRDESHRRRARLLYSHVDPQLVEESGSESLPDHIDGLFVETLLAGRWPDSYRCPVCDRFAVKKLHGDRRTRFWPSACRSKWYRMQRAQEPELGDLIAKELRIATGVDRLTVSEAHDRVCEKFGITLDQLRRMLN